MPNNLFFAIKDPVTFQELFVNLDISFSCYLVSAMTLNIFVLRKHLLIFDFCQYFILFFSALGAVSIKNYRNQFHVDYKRYN